MVAELVAAVQDPAGHVRVGVEPAADRQYGDPRARSFGLGQYGPGDGGVPVAVEGEGDPGAVARTVPDLVGLSGDPARGGRGRPADPCGRPGGRGRLGRGRGGGRASGAAGGGEGAGGGRRAGAEGGSAVRVAEHPPI